VITVVAAVIERQGRLLICQRRREDPFPLQWEFPGGKVEPGELPEEALKRELREELGVTLRRSREIARAEQTVPQLRTPREIRFFAADIDNDEIMPQVFEQILWVQPKELAEYDFLAANATLVAHLATGKIRPAEILEAGKPEA
jgi:8-oxo-dGTP diphosphatase